MSEQMDEVERQERLFESQLERHLHEELIEMTKAFYAQPTFTVASEQYTSSTKTQETGIRQGCPLSPYLFVMMMTVLLSDTNDCM